MVSLTTRQDAPAYVLQPEEGQQLDDLHLRLMATDALTGGEVCVLVCTNPGPGGPHLHTHDVHTEFMVVLQGRYRFKIGETEREGGPGTFAYIPRRVVHSWASVGPEEGRLLAAVFPGDFAGFLERLEDLSARGAGEDEVATLYVDYQSEINGPPLLQTHS